MTIVYKLTDEHMRTHGGTKWEIGVPKGTSGIGQLCGPGWLHAYTDPLLAVILNPIHANISKPRLFEAEASGPFLNDNGLKVGYTRMTLLREIAVPQVSTEQRVRFGILCALEIYAEPTFVAWANGWLSGADGTSRPAARVAWAAWAAAGAARAAWAAQAAADKKTLDLPAIARKAMEAA